MAGTEMSGGLSERELQIASFWVRNELILGKMLRGGLIAFSVLLFGYSIWGILDAFVISYPREKIIPQQIALNNQLMAGLESDRPGQISWGEPTVFANTDNRLDMFAEVSNPNPQWWADYSYRFTVAGEDTVTSTGYVMPSDVQIISALGFKPTTPGARSATLVVENIRWHRVKPAVTAEKYENFKKEHFDITAEKITFDPNIKLGTKTVSMSHITLVNNTAWGYKEVELIVKLVRGSQPAAFSKIIIANVQPNEHRDISITWFDAPVSVQNTEVVTQMNALDDDAYVSTEHFTAPVQ